MGGGCQAVTQVDQCSLEQYYVRSSMLRALIYNQACALEGFSKPSPLCCLPVLRACVHAARAHLQPGRALEGLLKPSPLCCLPVLRALVHAARALTCNQARAPVLKPCLFAMN